MSAVPRSMAVELALLFLKELEPQVPLDTERLVSTEAVLSFAEVKSSDPPAWQRWRAILEKYDKLELIEHMLGEPVPMDAGTSRSAADRLIGLMLESPIELFHDPDQHGWASIRVDGHWENHPIRSSPFQLFLLRTYYREPGLSPGAQAIHATQELLEAKALFDGDEALIHLRVAADRGNLYLDLCDKTWRAVEIGTEGWRVVDRPQPRFHRTRGSQPLPTPERGGSLDDLRRFLNVDQQGWILIRAFLVAALRPSVSCPILIAKGEQGAGKSTACRIISALIDPRTGALRGIPREVRDLVAAARNSWIVSFDNLSRLPDELADAACRLATGGGFGGRQLYSDHDQAIFDATRPLVFNAIPELGAARPDFLDRAVIIELEDITPEMRRDEAQFWREFEQARPRILGALLDVVVCGLNRLPKVSLEHLPRMADFALWVSACEGALGLETGEAMEAYRVNCAKGRYLALEASPIYEPLQEVARAGFRGTSSDLLVLLNKLSTDSSRRSRRWPKAPNALSNVLRRMAGNLRHTGIEISFDRADHQGRRTIAVESISVVSQRSSASSAPSGFKSDIKG